MSIEASQPCVIVTGSSGRIGTATVERLAQDYDVFALDQVGPKSALPSNAKFLEIDITSDPSVRAAIAEVNRERQGAIASVVHLAAYYSFSGEPSDLYEKVTVQGTKRLLDAVREHHPEQFIFSSTMLVHVPTKPGKPINENAPIEGKWDYPQSKIDTERIIEKEHGETPAVLLRLAGVYTDVCDSIPIAQQIRRIYENQLTSHVYPGDTSHGQAFVHMDDVVDAIARTITRGPRDIVPILIGEPQTYSYNTLQRTLGKLIHNDDNWTTTHVPKVVAKTGAWVQGKTPGTEESFIKPWMIDMADDHYELDITRARELLGWQPQHRLIDTLPRMVAALRADPRKWYERHGLEPRAR